MQPSHTTPRPARSRRAHAAVLVFVLLALCGGVGIIGWELLGDWVAFPRSSATAVGAGLRDVVNYKIARNDYPVVQRPPVVPAASAVLPEDAEVIGVTAGTRHRAYALSALAPEAAHV